MLPITPMREPVKSLQIAFFHFDITYAIPNLFHI